MSIRDNFIKLYRNSYGTSNFPIWEYGTQIKLGDYGAFKDQQFERHGNLSDIFNGKILETFSEEGRSNSDLNLFSQVSEGANAGGKIVKGMQAEAKITFSAEAGFLFQSDDESNVTFRYLGDLLKAIKYEKMDRGTYIVTSVTTARNSVFIGASTSDFTVDVNADASLLETWRLGKAGIQLKATNGTGVAQSYTEEDKPLSVAMQLHKVTWLNKVKSQSASEDEIEVIPYSGEGEEGD